MITDSSSSSESTDGQPNNNTENKIPSPNQNNKLTNETELIPTNNNNNTNTNTPTSPPPSDKHPSYESLSYLLGTTDNSELQNLYRSETHISVPKLLFCVLNWLVLLVFSFARDGKGGAPSLFGVKKCSALDWTLVALVVILSLIFAGITAVVVLIQQKKKDRLHYIPADGAVTWHLTQALFYPLFCISAGILAGLLGVGGAIVTSPVLLEMGVSVPVVTSTTAALLFATSSSSTAQYAVSGILSPLYGVIFFLLGLLGALAVTCGIARLAVKYKRYSVLLLSIALLYACALVLSVFHGTYSLVVLLTHGGSVAFSSPCK